MPSAREHQRMPKSHRQSPSQNATLEKKRQRLAIATQDLVMTSLHNLTDRRPSYNEQFAALQHKLGASVVIGARDAILSFTDRSQSAFDIAQLAAR